MFLRKVKLLYISSLLFFLGKSIRLFESKLARTAPYNLSGRKTVRLGRKTEKLKKKFSIREAQFFRVLYSMRLSS